MPDMVLFDQGAQALLEIIGNDQRGIGGNDLTLRLYTNDHTPTDSDDETDYTEAAGGGYAAKTLTMGNWTTSIAAGIAQMLYAMQSFIFTGPLTGNPGIYGAYVTDADGVAILAQGRASVFTPVNDGDHLDVTPKFKLSKGTPS